MESDGTDISTSSAHHELVYICTCADNKRVVSDINDILHSLH